MDCGHGNVYDALLIVNLQCNVYDVLPIVNLANRAYEFSSSTYELVDDNNNILPAKGQLKLST